MSRCTVFCRFVLRQFRIGQLRLPCRVGKIRHPFQKCPANQSLIDERGVISRLSSPHDYEKTFRNETRGVRNRFFVCVCRSISTMYSLNYRFCAAVQNTSLTNKLSATDAKDQIQYDARLKKHPTRRYIHDPPKRKREKQKMILNYSKPPPPPSHPKRKEKR